MSTLSLLYYRVSEMEFKFNENQKPNTAFQIKPKIECKIAKKEDHVYANLKLKINEDISSPVPFNLKVVLVGTFKSKENAVFDEALQKAQVADACATLYPYLRSIVANLTVNCNLPAYFLPAMTADQLTAIEQHEVDASKNNNGDKN